MAQRHRHMQSWLPSAFQSIPLNFLVCTDAPKRANRNAVHVRVVRDRQRRLHRFYRIQNLGKSCRNCETL